MSYVLLFQGSLSQGNNSKKKKIILTQKKFPMLAAIFSKLKKLHVPKWGNSVSRLHWIMKDVTT